MPMGQREAWHSRARHVRKFVVAHNGQPVMTRQKIYEEGQINKCIHTKGGLLNGGTGEKCGLQPFPMTCFGQADGQYGPCVTVINNCSAHRETVVCERLRGSHVFTPGPSARPESVIGILSVKDNLDSDACHQSPAAACGRSPALNWRVCSHFL